jgi:hypothetical protein
VKFSAFRPTVPQKNLEHDKPRVSDDDAIATNRAMEGDEDLGNVFAIPDLSCPPRYRQITQEPSGFLFSELAINGMLQFCLYNTATL